MNELILSLLPALAFLLVACISVWGIWFWSTYLSVDAKARRQRLKSVAMQRPTAAPAGRVNAEERRGASLTPLLAVQPLLARIDVLLRSAGSPKKAPEILTLCLLIAVVTGVGLWWRFPGLGGYCVLPALLVGTLPIVFYRRQRAKRRERFLDQFPDALDFMSRALRAGHSLPTAIRMIAEELPDPIAREFRIVFDEINLGQAFDDALDLMAERVDSPDFWVFVSAIMIQRESGGNLAELLDKLASVMRERRKLSVKVRILANEGRVSGWVLGLLPFAMAGLISLLNPDYLAPLLQSPNAREIIVGTLLWMGLGAWVMRNIVQVKV